MALSGTVNTKFILVAMALSLFATACTTPAKLGKANSYLFYRDVPYADYGDDIKLIADIYDPDNLNAPIVLLIHGGEWNSRSGDMQSIAQDLAKKGFLVYAATYRLVPKAIFPAQLDDMKNALKFIQADAPTRSGDPSKIFVWGYSSGGYLAFMLGLNPENKIKGIVTGATPTDFTEFPKSPVITKFLGRSYAQDPKYWTLVSAVNNIHEQSPPVFMYHGDDDSLVDIEQMFLMKEELEKKKIPVTARAVNGLGHVSLYLLDQKSVNQAIDFLLGLANNEVAVPKSDATVAPTVLDVDGQTSTSPPEEGAAPGSAMAPSSIAPSSPAIESAPKPSAKKKKKRRR